MITNSQIRAIESSLEKLKPTLYGMKVKYDCSVIEENLRFNLGFNELGAGSYKPMLRIKMTLDGSPNIYVVTPGILEAEVEGFLSKVFTYVLPSDHLLVSRPWATVFEFYYGVQKILYSEEEVLILLHERDVHNMHYPSTFNKGWKTPKEWFKKK